MPAKSNIINVRLAPALKQRLEEHSRASALSSSDVIRLALARYLDHDAAHSETMMRQVGTMHDRLHKMADYLNTLHRHVVDIGHSDEAYARALQDMREEFKVLQREQLAIIDTLTRKPAAP